MFQTADPVICGITVAEFWAGGRTPAQRSNYAAILGLCRRVPTPEDVWEQAGRNQALLASSGLTVPLPDTIIATIAIAAGVELWTYDAHFAVMATLLPGLILYQEP